MKVNVSNKSLSAVQGFLPNLALALARVSFGLIMAFGHGLAKFPISKQLVDGVAHLGFPSPLVFAWLAALSEFLGGIFVALGFLTRFNAAVLTFTMGVAAFLVHRQDAFATKEMALLYFVIFGLFAFLGGGQYSLDGFFKIGNKK
jgi:putative oxidoreductase